MEIEINRSSKFIMASQPNFKKTVPMWLTENLTVKISAKTYNRYKFYKKKRYNDRPPDWYKSRDIKTPTDYGAKLLYKKEKKDNKQKEDLKKLEGLEKKMYYRKKGIKQKGEELDKVLEQKKGIKKEFDAVDERVAVLKDEIGELEYELRKLTKQRELLVKRLKAMNKREEELDEEIFQLSIECKIHCNYKRDPANCPKEDKTNCVYLGNKSLDNYIAGVKAGEQ